MALVQELEPVVRRQLSNANYVATFVAENVPLRLTRGSLVASYCTDHAEVAKLPISVTGERLGVAGFSGNVPDWFAYQTAALVVNMSI